VYGRAASYSGENHGSSFYEDGVSFHPHEFTVASDVSDLDMKRPGLKNHHPAAAIQGPLDVLGIFVMFL
jgi:hypothetical protein